MSTAFCCLGCRLLQSPAPDCAECGSHLMASLDTEIELLRRRNMDVTATKGSTGLGIAAGFAGYAGLIVAGAVWWPLIPIVLGAGATTGTVVGLRRRGRLAGVPRQAVVTSATAVTRRGIAHRLDTTVPGLVDRAPTLAEEVVLYQGGAVLFRRVAAAPFLLEVEGGERVVVAGVIRVASSESRERVSIAKRDPIYDELGIPQPARVRAKLEVTSVRDGARVSVTSDEADEMVPELAFHRDSGQVPVMRGRAGAVASITVEA